MRFKISLIALSLTCLAGAQQKPVPPTQKDQPPKQGQDTKKEEDSKKEEEPEKRKDAQKEPEPKKEEIAAPKEYTVKAAPFTVDTEISGTLIPTKVQAISLTPAQWKSFVIESIPAHGTVLQAGDPLIVFETEVIDRALVEKEAAVKSQELKVAIANRELTEMQQKNALTLAKAKSDMENAESDLAYYQEIGEEQKKRSLAYQIQAAEDYLSYEKEELTQLLKMYEEDDITEETEEIILVRQKARVRDAEHRLAEMKLDTERTLEAGLPRSLLSRQSQVESARIDYATAKLNLERGYELKTLEIAKMDRALEAAKKELADLTADRALFDTVAEFEGNLVYGEFANAEWKKGKLPDALKAGGTAPTLKTILTLVATDSPLSLQTQMDTKKMKELQESLADASDDAPEVSVAPYPNLSGKHLVTLPPKPAEAFQFPGQKDKAKIVFYTVENALTIPMNAVKTKEDGSTYAMVKLSEGDPEERVIELGRKNGDVVEVLSGLEEGQVVLP